MKNSAARWQIEKRGRIEAEFLFEAVLPGDILPFAVIDSELAFLPLSRNAGGTLLLKSDELTRRGSLYAARWLKDNEQTWRREDPITNLLGVLDSDKGLTLQNHRCRSVVLYRTGPRSAASRYIPSGRAQGCSTNGFVVDDQTLYYYPETDEEADYLTIMLNCLKPDNEFNVPSFDAGDHYHKALAQLGRECRIAAEQCLTRDIKDAKNIRSAIRQIAKSKLSEIATILKSMDLPNQGT